MRKLILVSSFAVLSMAFAGTPQATSTSQPAGGASMPRFTTVTAPTSIYDPPATSLPRNSTTPMQAYWNAVYPQIASCMKQVIDARKMPYVKDESSKHYIAGLGLGTGYYVMVDTSHYTTSDVCYIDYTARQIGYTPHYIEPVERLIIGIFAREPDAVSLADKLKAMKIDTEVLYIKSSKTSQSVQFGNATPQLDLSGQISSLLNDYVTKSDFYKAIDEVNKQLQKQNEINQQLYNEIVQLKQQLMVQQSPQPAPQNASADEYKIAKVIRYGGAVLRFGPSFRSGIYKWIARGTTLYVVNTLPQWYEVKLHRGDKQTFFIYKSLVEVEQ